MFAQSLSQVYSNVMITNRGQINTQKAGCLSTYFFETIYCEYDLSEP